MTDMYNYIFDWRMVLKECPEYAEYLTEKVDEPWDGVGINMLDIEYPITRVKSQDLSEDELEIVNQMHAGQPKPLEISAALREQAGLLPDGLRDAIHDINERITYKEDKEYMLKPEYQNQPPQGIPSVLMLPPPKRFLGTDSSFFKSPTTHYRVHHNRERNPDVVDIHWTHLSYTYPKVRIMFTIYRFDRAKDVMTESKKHLSSVIFNLDTFKLYEMKKAPSGDNTRGSVKNRYHKVINQGFLQLGRVQAMFPSNDAFIRQFYHIVLEHAKKRMPDIYCPPERMPIRRRTHNLNRRITLPKTVSCIPTALVMLMLQIRVGRPLPWLENMHRFTSMACLANTENIYTLLQSAGAKDDGPNGVHNYKRRNSYKLVGKLKENPRPKAMLRALLGPYYKGLYYKMLLIEDTDCSEYIPTFAGKIASNEVPTCLCHFVSYIIKTWKDTDIFRNYLETATNSIPASLGRTAWGDIAEFTNDHYVGIYVKLAKRFLKSDEGKALSWHTLRDTFRMAKELNIRIRPNKFKSEAEISDIHDKLAAIQRRDLYHSNRYAGFEFLHFKTPDREYAGFKFTQLTTPEQLMEEGTTMHHCVGGYSGQCLSGSSIIFSMNKDDRSWVTLELRGDAGHMIMQRYTIKDFTVNNPEILQAIEDWHMDVVRMHRDDDRTYSAIAGETHARTKKEIQEKERAKLLDELRHSDHVEGDIQIREEDADATIIEQAYALAP